MGRSGKGGAIISTVGCRTLLEFSEFRTRQATTCLSNDLLFLILDKTLSPIPPGIDSKTLASLSCVSTRFANLLKGHGWERACRTAVPELCTALLDRGQQSPGDAGWASFAKLLTRCPGYQWKQVRWMSTETYFGDEIVGKGTKKTLHVFYISLPSHAYGSWATSKSESLRVCLEGGEILFPELIEGGGLVLIFPTCEVSPHVEVQFASCDWVREIASPNEWHAWKELSYEGKCRPCPKTLVPKAADVRIFQGMASDTTGLASLWGTTDNSNEHIFNDELSALEVGRNEASNTPTVVQCPFCSKSMREIRSPLVHLIGRNASQSIAIFRLFRFHACSAGHIYGASVELTYEMARELPREDDEGS